MSAVKARLEPLLRYASVLRDGTSPSALHLLRTNGDEADVFLRSLTLFSRRIKIERFVGDPVNKPLDRFMRKKCLGG